MSLPQTLWSEHMNSELGAQPQFPLCETGWSAQMPSLVYFTPEYLLYFEYICYFILI
jgi:hypothetical protein